MSYDGLTLSVRVILHALDLLELSGEYREGDRLDGEFIRRLLARESVQVILLRIEQQLEQGASPESIASHIAGEYGAFLRDAVIAVHAEWITDQDYESVLGLMQRRRFLQRHRNAKIAEQESLESELSMFTRRSVPYPLTPDDLPVHEQHEALLYLEFLQNLARELIDRAAEKHLGLQLPLEATQVETVIQEWIQTNQGECKEQNFPEFPFWFEEGARFGYENDWRSSTSLPWICLENEKEWLYLWIPQAGSALYHFSHDLLRLYRSIRLWTWHEVNDFALFGKPLPPRVGVRFLGEPYGEKELPLLTMHFLPFLSESTVATLYRKAAMREGAGNRLTALNLAMITVEKKLELAGKNAPEVWNRLTPAEWHYEGRRASEMFNKTFRRAQQKWWSSILEPRDISHLVI